MSEELTDLEFKLMALRSAIRIALEEHGIGGTDLTDIQKCTVRVGETKTTTGTWHDGEFEIARICKIGDFQIPLVTEIGRVRKGERRGNKFIQCTFGYGSTKKTFNEGKRGFKVDKIVQSVLDYIENTKHERLRQAEAQKKREIEDVARIERIGQNSPIAAAINQTYGTNVVKYDYEGHLYIGDGRQYCTETQARKLVACMSEIGLLKKTPT